MTLDVMARLAPFFSELAQAQYKRTEQEAKANPRAYRTSRVFPPGVNTSYRYYPAGKDGRGRTIRFCWSCHRNVAGYFLAWREVRSKDGSEGRRDQWAARRTRKRLEERAKRLADAFRAKHAGRAP